MSIPPYPSPAGSALGPRQPGLYPLRPLTIGEILGTGLRVAWRHLVVLAPFALVVSLLGTAANIAVLAANGSLRSFATGDYAVLPQNATPDQVSALLTNLVHHILPGVAATLVISLIGAPILAGLVTPFAAMGATSTAGTNAAGMARLKGRWPVVVGTGVVAGLAISVGYTLLIVPGVIIWLMLVPAGPVAAMEGLSIGDSIRRATALSKGFKGRLLGVSLLIGLILTAISFTATSILGTAISTTDPVRHLFLVQGLGILISALLTPWSSAVTAMLYVDIRMRREGLAHALAASVR